VGRPWMRWEDNIGRDIREQMGLAGQEHLGVAIEARA